MHIVARLSGAEPIAHVAGRITMKHADASRKLRLAIELVNHNFFLI